MIIEVAVIAAVSDFKIFGPSVTPIDFFFYFKLSYSLAEKSPSGHMILPIASFLVSFLFFIFSPLLSNEQYK